MSAIYFSEAMAGPAGLALFLKNWSMVLGSGTWYGRASIDSKKTHKQVKQDLVVLPIFHF